MECLLCYNIIFDDFDSENEQSFFAPQIICCKLLDMPILRASFCNGHFCANCHEKLRHVGQLFDELEKMRVDVEVELMRSQKSSQDEFNENENRAVIVKEIEKRWTEKGDHHQILNIKKKNEEIVDDSDIDFDFDQLLYPIQETFIMDSNGDIGPAADPKDFSHIKDEMRVILEPIQFTLARLQEAEAEESTFNVKVASIAKYIARDQDRVNKINLQRYELFQKCEKLQRVKLRVKKKSRSKKLTRTKGIQIQNNHQISSSNVDKSPEKNDLGMTNDSSNSTLYCSVCDRYFKTSENLKRHKIECHSKSKSFHCEKCGKIFFVKRNLKKHMIVHQTECPFQCEICSKFYKTKRKLTLHLKIHGIGDTIQCEVCSKFFYCEPSKKQHMANVHGEGPQPKSHLCNICGKVYAHRPAYLNHYKSVHAGIRVKCDQCDLVFESRDKLRYHISRVHEEKSKNFLCEEPNCSKRNYDLRKHINEVHLKKRNHVCSECGEKLVSKTRLSEHIMSKHTHEKQHFCRFCGKGFVIKSHLTRHEKENCSQNRQI